jgi:hypothetical protein
MTRTTWWSGQKPEPSLKTIVLTPNLTRCLTDETCNCHCVKVRSHWIGTWQKIWHCSFLSSSWSRISGKGR